MNKVAIFMLISVMLLATTLSILYYPKNKAHLHTPPPLIPTPENTIHPITRKSSTGEIATPIQELIKRVNILDVDQVKKEKFHVAISIHDLQTEWSKTLLLGIKEILTQYDVEIIAITDGEFNVKKQLADYQEILTLNPDLIITLPLNNEQIMIPLKEAITHNIKLIFTESRPKGLKTPQDYTGWVVGDSYVLGEISAELLSDHLKKSGKVALLHWKKKMFTANQRSLGAREHFQKIAGIEIVEELYFTERHEIPMLIDNLLEKHPDLSGLWTVHNTTALEAIKTFKKHNKRIPVTTIDLNKGIAQNLLNKGMLVGTAADHPYHQGITLGLLAIATLNNLKVPPFHVIHAEKITLKNLSKSWKRIFRVALPFEQE